MECLPFARLLKLFLHLHLNVSVILYRCNHGQLLNIFIVRIYSNRSVFLCLWEGNIIVYDSDIGQCLGCNFIFIFLLFLLLFVTVICATG